MITSRQIAVRKRNSVVGTATGEPAEGYAPIGVLNTFSPLGQGRFGLRENVEIVYKPQVIGKSRPLFTMEGQSNGRYLTKAQVLDTAREAYQDKLILVRTSDGIDLRLIVEDAVIKLIQ